MQGMEQQIEEADRAGVKKLGLWDIALRSERACNGKNVDKARLVDCSNVVRTVGFKGGLSSRIG